MSKQIVIIVVVAVVVLAGGGVWLATRNSSNKSGGNMPMSTNQNQSNSQATATNAVTIENFAFSPASITVKKGTIVTWTNKDSVAHTVTETDGKTGPDSGNLANGKSYSFTYDTVGTFAYNCSIHPNMTGTVTVTE